MIETGNNIPPPKPTHWYCTDASSIVPISFTQPVGTAVPPVVPDAPGLSGGSRRRILRPVSHRRWVALLALLALALTALWLQGCQLRGSNHPAGACPGSGATLISIGEWTVVAGCAAVGAGILAVVASFFPPTSFLAYFRPVIAEVVALGIAAILLGTSFIWLGTHAWLLALVVALLCAGLAVRYRVRITRFLGLAGKPKRSPEPLIPPPLH